MFFIARELRSTAKAVYLYGHGTMQTQTRFNICCNCGRTLSHPGSILIGMGPICLGDWKLRTDMIEGKSQDEIDLIIGKAMVDRKIDCWFPRAAITEQYDSTEEVGIPIDHPMLNSQQNVQTKTARQVTMKKKGRFIRIEFPYHPDLVTKMKTLPNWKFESNDTSKWWTCNLDPQAVIKLQGWGFTLDKRLQDLVVEASKEEDKRKVEIDNAIENIELKLYPFQKEGVAFIEKRNGRMILADEMGLGKTIQALVYGRMHPEFRPMIVVPPASLKGNWEKETNKWVDNPNVQVISGTNSSADALWGDIIIINYDILPNDIEKYFHCARCDKSPYLFCPICKSRCKKKVKQIHYTGWVDYLIDLKPQLLVIDEIHYIKNDGANRTTAIKRLGASCPHILGLTGTLIKNRPLEALNAIQLIDINREVVSSPWYYKQHYCGATHNGFGWDFNGSSNTKELHNILTSTIMLRRKKADVLKDLPKKQRSIIPLEITNRKEYQRAENDFLEWLENKKGSEAALRASRAETFAKIAALKKLCGKGKNKQVVNWIKDYLENEDKLVIFAHHKEVISGLMADLEEYNPVKIDGATSAKNKDKAKEMFQTDPNVRVIIGSEAMKEGHNLQIANATCFIELWWSPGDHDQAEDRVHRIGQKADSVMAYYLVGSHTIEEEIATLIDKKRKVMDAVLDGKDTEEEALLSELLSKYRKAA